MVLLRKSIIGAATAEYKLGSLRSQNLSLSLLACCAFCSLAPPGTAIPDPKFGVYIIQIYMYYIQPDLRILRLPLSIRKGSRATLEGAAREHGGALRKQEGAEGAQ